MKYWYIYILIGFLLSIDIDNEDIYDTSWALIIGINDYEKITDLSYGVSDADAIKNLLILDYGFPRDNVRVLLNGDATALNIRKELHEILKNADSSKAIPPLYGALLKNEQDVQLLERLAFMSRREANSK